MKILLCLILIFLPAIVGAQPDLPPLPSDTVLEDPESSSAASDIFFDNTSSSSSTSSSATDTATDTVADSTATTTTDTTADATTATTKTTSVTDTSTGADTWTVFGLSGGLALMALLILSGHKKRKEKNDTA
ncbi:MAG: hypothetical protein CEN89_760 [Candidatus Berkelbacteria bacterium Licking1014_7]|uniref:Gram-positive cocci surface proteins LPxTG domain-containing protein n=1 Tax=Candidatus Berkelbacteria bacterium Licking1014_7 TaxID=2017147 RepID=A0A554LHI9_9BACT|nr:MAG: hypothetical protein CEN89_760 [Candidatus Berkelbacteria bacterium Licking1014_7]